MGYVSHDELREIISKAIAPVIKEHIAQKFGALEKRLDAIEASMADTPYKGVHQSAMSYKRGDFVTDGGSMWHCNRDLTTQKPGAGADWSLAVKKGRDG